MVPYRFDLWQELVAWCELDADAFAPVWVILLAVVVAVVVYECYQAVRHAD